ncbi:helix-turn-helix domain-containing protein [Colwellia sp. 20A7]|uniref:helix-turn-helix domain-containing protein n=1 Tax=Colwellia sp. 20A7 TaxID=2689569 RepID=UPI001F4402EB|nr:helix-turn-helix transcriptional regulator [Colwellia sp. 20A7]
MMTLDSTNKEYNLLAQCITSLNSVNFSQQLVEFIDSFIDYDCLLILGYRQGKHPIYLYDSIDSKRELLFQRYLINSFVYDPFYIALTQNNIEGVYSLQDVISDIGEYKNYQQEFYYETNWQDELGLTVRIDEARWVVIYFGYTQTEKKFTEQQKQQLKNRYPLIQALCHQHWSHDTFVLGSSKHSNISQAIKEGVATFGKDLLTLREQEITALLVQGYDSKDVSAHLSITIGTVKNHRKRIYSQLNVASLSELFQLFLNHIARN